MKIQYEANAFNECCIFIYCCCLITASKFIFSICSTVSGDCVPAVKTLPTIFQPHPKRVRLDVHQLSRTASGKPRPRLSCSGTINHGGGNVTGNNAASEMIQGVRATTEGDLYSFKNVQSDWETDQSPVFPNLLGRSGWWELVLIKMLKIYLQRSGTVRI